MTPAAPPARTAQTSASPAPCDTRSTRWPAGQWPRERPGAPGPPHPRAARAALRGRDPRRGRADAADLGLDAARRRTPATADPASRPGPARVAAHRSPAAPPAAPGRRARVAVPRPGPARHPPAGTSPRPPPRRCRSAPARSAAALPRACCGRRSPCSPCWSGSSAASSGPWATTASGTTGWFRRRARRRPDPVRGPARGRQRLGAGRRPGAAAQHRADHRRVRRRGGRRHGVRLRAGPPGPHRHQQPRGRLRGRGRRSDQGRRLRGTRYDAKVVGRSPVYDLAILQVDGGEALVPAALGASTVLHVGDPVVAFGSPLGLSQTVTSGIVSALNRPVTTGDSDNESSYINAVQTISFFFLQDFIGYIYRINYKNHHKYLIIKYRNFHGHISKVYTHRQSLNFSKTLNLDYEIIRKKAND